MRQDQQDQQDALCNELSRATEATPLYRVARVSCVLVPGPVGVRASREAIGWEAGWWLFGIEYRSGENTAGAHRLLSGPLSGRTMTAFCFTGSEIQLDGQRGA